MAETTDDSAVRQEGTAPAESSLGLDLAEYPTRAEISEQRQQLKALFLQAPLGISAVMLLAVGLTVFLWNQVPDYLLLPWLAFLGLNNALHAYILREYNHHEKRIEAITSWTRYQTMLAGASALAWGVGFAVMLPHLGMQQQMLYLLLLALLCAVHLPVLGTVFQSYASFIVLAGVPVLFGLLVTAQSVSLAWMIGVLLVSAGLLAAAYSYHGVLRRAFQLAESAHRYADSLYETSEKHRLANLQLRKAVHDQQQYGRRLSDEKLSTELTLRSIKEAVITTDMHGRIAFMNPLAERYTGWTAELAHGQPTREVVRIIDEQTRIRIDDPVGRCLQARSTVFSTDASVLVRRDGLEYGIEFDTSPLRDDQGEMRGAVIVIRDVTQSRDQVRTLSWQATHDPLTGLINRREFEQRMEKLMEKALANQRQHALCFIDLDNFKLINDTCGHVAGDALLKQIASQLRNRIRDTDTLARVGGDEFGLILYSCDLKRARMIGESLRDTVSELNFSWEGHQFNVGASIGIVPVNSHNSVLSDIIRNADIACYQAKEKGGGQVIILKDTTGKETGTESETRWVESVMHSIENRRFRLYLQPVQPLDSENPVTMTEVLLRVCDNEDRIIMPKRFLNVAQRYHLLPQIDLAVIENVLSCLRDNHQALESSARITINLSVQTANNEHCLNSIADLLQRHQSYTSRLCFDLDEKALVSEPGKGEALLSLLRRHGCKVAIDDFGFSLGAFRYLKTLNLDYIKIDARQMHDPEPRSLDYTLIESINLLSHRIGAQTIVKNVSDTSVLEALHEIGVDYVQGYIIGPPEEIRSSGSSTSQAEAS